MTLILGIDPGSQTTGYGFIEAGLQQHKAIAFGCIRTKKFPTMAERLKVIYRELYILVQEYRPEEVAIEDVFVSRNPQTALKLGHARAAALLAVANNDLPIAEYQPRKVKKSVVGSGQAIKEQVQLMVCMLLRLSQPLQADAADALAVAICHAHHRNTVAYQLGGHTVRHKKGRWSVKALSRQIS